MITLADRWATLLGKLDNVRASSNGEHAASCPLCDDGRGQHLSLKLGTGTIALYCHHGCDNGAILDSLGLEFVDLYPEKERRIKPDKLGPLVATYDYTDETGKLLFQKTRHDPKDFRQRRPDGSGGWIWKLDDTRRVLYRLSELFAYIPGQTTFLNEGEKSADAIRGLGLLATCNVGGAGKWKPEYTAALADMDVVILSDNDADGQKHANTVAAALMGTADRVRVLNLGAGKRLGYDPADWVYDGGSTAELLSLIQKVPDYTPPAEPDPPAKTETETPETEKPKKKKKPYPKSSEYISVLAALGYSFRMNQCNDRVEVNRQPMSDALESKIRAELRDRKYLRVNVAKDAYIAYAYDHSYHPIKDYLNGLEWDRVDHIGDLAGYFEDADDIFPTFLKRWLIGAVAKVYRAEQNRMLVLDGKQDIGKSHFVRWLAGGVPDPYFVEAPIDPDDKDTSIRLMSCWLWEVAELGSTTRKADREALKHFLTQRQVTVRAPYGHYDLVKPALASFIGTVNNECGILSDPTGSRRFMVCNLTGIDWGYTDLDAGQVWAQAVWLYRAGEPWRLTDAARAKANEINAGYEIEEPLDAFILNAFVETDDPKKRMTTLAIITELKGAGWTGERTQRREAMEISKAMTRLGFEKYRTRSGTNTTERGYWCTTGKVKE